MKTLSADPINVELLSSDQTVQSLVRAKVLQHNDESIDEPFIIGDLGDIINKREIWDEYLPRVKPFYAVKCNDDQNVLKLLADMGTNFDCASKDEIRKVLELGISPSRIIYANPCKQASMLKYAAKKQVATMTFDNEAELHKIKKLYPEARLVLRILPPSNFKVQCELGIKFGCHPSKAEHLLQVAQHLQLNVVGISFHVGSGCEDADAFACAISEARKVFTCAQDMGFNMELLDIGGGFPGQASAPISFHEISSVVNMALDKYFPADCGVEIIAEPGRYFVASAFTLVVNIIAKRVVARDQQSELGELIDHPSLSEEPSMMYYVNDGVYGSFNCLLFDHAKVEVSLIEDDDPEITYQSSVWGPTCDGLDCILESVQLPDLQVGQWLYFKDMGAYTMAAASSFNGMPTPIRSYHCLSSLWHKVYPDSVQGSFPAIPCKMSAALGCAEGLSRSYETALTSAICVGGKQPEFI